MKEWKKIYHPNSNQKRAGVKILILDKIDFKFKKVTSNKGGHYILIKGSIQQEDKTIINIYTPNNRSSKYMKQKSIELKGEIINSSTIIVGDFNTSILILDRTTMQKVSKEIDDLNNTIIYLDLTDIYRKLYPTTEYTFFSSAHGTFSRIDCMLSHK